MGIVDDTMPLKFLASSSGPTYMHHITVRELLIKQKNVLSSLLYHVKHVPAAKTLGIKSPTRRNHYIFSEKNILFKNLDADAIVNNDHESTRIYEIALYRYARAILDEPYASHLEQRNDRLSTFALLFEIKSYHTRIISYWIMSDFIKSVRCFAYNANDKSKVEEESWGAQRTYLVEAWASFQTCGEIFF